MSMRHVTGMTCVQCGARHGPDVETTCPACGLEGILDVLYDYDEVARTLDRASLERREPWMWRYRELLPLDELAELPHLHVGMTPVYGALRLAEWAGLRSLYVKDDGRNPTASFKDRASAVGVAKAVEKGRRVVAAASTGNAASSLAGFAAAMGVSAIIFVPERAPEPKLAQLLIFGATVFRVRASYDETWMLCQKAVERFGWYNRNCAVNPYLVEGKKTVGLEIAEQLADRMPDWVVLSVGDGCTLAGAHKGLWEMQRLGLVKTVPRLLGVQAAGAAPVLRAFESKGALVPDPKAETLADSICVGTPRNWRKAIKALEASRGAMVAVSDEQILDAMRACARRAAVFGEPAAAAAVAGLKVAVARGIIGKDESALVVVTGNGLKDVKSAIRAVEPPVDVDPTIDDVEREIRSRGLEG